MTRYGKVVDLGTEFGMDVSKDTTVKVVMEPRSVYIEVLNTDGEPIETILPLNPLYDSTL